MSILSATMSSALGEAPSVSHFQRRVLWPVSLVTFAMIGLAALGLYWATSRSDMISAARQVRGVEHAIQHSVDALAKEQEIVAIWDDTVLLLRSKEPDWQWVDDNIGVWLHDLYGHDRVYILDYSERAIYAMEEGARTEPTHYARIADDVMPLIDALRGRTGEANSRYDRLPNKEPDPEGALLTSGAAVHATGLVNIVGRPAAVSAMRIAPLTKSVTQLRGTEPLLVSVRFLGADFLHDLSAHSLVAQPRVSTAPTLREGEASLPLVGRDRSNLGYLMWHPELPGTTIMSVLGPGTAFAALGMVLVMAHLVRGLYRSMRDQQTTMGELKATMLELEASEAHAQHLALHDVLTGLPNRALLTTRLEQALARARVGQDVTVLLLDLDRFKHVNDTLGHQAGDALICALAERLAKLVDANDTLARLGGDEFAIVRVSGPGKMSSYALCRDILKAVREPFNVLGSQCIVGISIGLAESSVGGTERTDLLRKADIALYCAKDGGRDRFCVFAPEMDETVKTRQGLEEELRQALASGTSLRVFYQPQVAGVGHAIVGLEALVRWEHPTRGLLLPAQFIPIAEESGLICELGAWVLHEACAASLRWPGLFMAVNLSPVQFRSVEFAKSVIEIAHQNGADPHMIELEVTESLLLDDGELVRGALKELRTAGFRIALDDFGTGYSSLSYLRSFAVDKIKIDRTFVQHLGQTGESAAIVTAVVTLGHAMGLIVTGEGVETEEQSWFLETAGCDVMQGFKFSRAVPEEELKKLIPSRPVHINTRRSVA